MDALKSTIIRLHNSQYPRLKQVNGLLNLGVIGFGWFNLVLGACLFTQVASTRDFFIINDVFTYQLWGASFFLGGLALIIGHAGNWWTMMRWTILTLLFFKFVWLAALIQRQVTEGTNIFLLLFFALATFLQMAGYLYFPVYKRIKTWSD